MFVKCIRCSTSIALTESEILKNVRCSACGKRQLVLKQLYIKEPLIGSQKEVVTQLLRDQVVKKVAVVRKFSLGDILMTTPALRELKKQFPNVEIDYVTRPEYEQVLRYNPYVKRILSRPDEENYHIIFDLSGVTDGTEKESENAIDVFCSRIGVNPNDKTPEIFLTGFEKLEGRRLIQDRSNVVVIAPGSNVAERQWEYEYVYELSQALYHGGYTVVLLDSKPAPYAMPNVIDYTGKLSIRQMFSVVFHSQFVISTDSGVTHVAAAFKIPNLVLFSYVDPELRVKYYDNVVEVVRDSSKSMLHIYPEDVIEKLSKHLRVQKSVYNPPNLEEKVGVCVLFHNNENLVNRCVTALLKNSPRNIKILLIDNGSTDRTYELLTQISDERVEVYRSESNLGVAKGRNLGGNKLYEKGLDYFVFLDSDQIVRSGWLESMLEEMKSRQLDVIGVEGWFLNLVTDYLVRVKDSPTYVGGGGMIISKKVVDRIGWFDETYEMAYWEDTDYCFRCKEANLSFDVVRRPRIVHLQHQTLKGELKKYREKNRDKFLKKWVLPEVKVVEQYEKQNRFVYIQPTYGTEGSFYKYYAFFMQEFGGTVVREGDDVWEFLRVYKPKLVFCHGSRLKNYLFPYLLKIPYVLIEHDVMSLFMDATHEEIRRERVMIENAVGVIFTSEDHLSYMKSLKYNVPLHIIVYLRPLRSDLNFELKEKLPGKHLVYAGGILPWSQRKGIYGYRCYHRIFESFKKCSWDVHIYPYNATTKAINEYKDIGCIVHSPLPYNELLKEMSSYTAGLQAFANEECNPKSFSYTQSCRPNKIWDYLAASIPTIGYNPGNGSKIYVDGGWGIEIKDLSEKTLNNIVDSLPVITQEMRQSNVMDNDKDEICKFLGRIIDKT